MNAMGDNVKNLCRTYWDGMVCGLALIDGKIELYGFSTDADKNTLEGAQDMRDDLVNFRTSEMFDVTSENIVEYKGFKYNLNAIKGNNNSFAEKVGNVGETILSQLTSKMI